MSIKQFSFTRWINLSLVFVSRILIFFSENLFLSWFLIDLNMFFAASFFFKKNFLYSSKAFYYYFLQIFGSFLFLVGLLMVRPIISISGLFVKLGIFPFFFWLPKIMSDFSWPSVAVVLVLQKIAPLYLLSIFKNGIVGYKFLLFCSFFLRLGGMFLSRSNLKLLLGWSSIKNTTIVVFLIPFEFQMATFYFIMYSLGVVLVCFFMGQSFYGDCDFKTIARVFCLLIFAGAPPLFGFLYKVSFIETLKFDCLWSRYEEPFFLEMFDILVGKTYVVKRVIIFVVRIFLIAQIVAYTKIFIFFFSKGSNVKTMVSKIFVFRLVRLLIFVVVCSFVAVYF